MKILIRDENKKVVKEEDLNSVGEGIVWTGIWKQKQYRFKVKGEKHSVTKVKKLAEVDLVKLKSIDEFIEYAVTKNRVEQGVNEVQAKDDKDTGMVIRWVIQDVIKEELDAMEAAGISTKEIGRAASAVIRRYYVEIMEGE